MSTPPNQRQPDETAAGFRRRRKAALRSPLGLPTAVFDSSRLIRGNGTLADQFAGEEANLETMVATARAGGYNPSPNDTYKPALAEFPGDPLAFVPADDPEGHIRRVCKQQGKACRGVVDYTPPVRDPEPDGLVRGINPEIVGEAVAMQIADDPGLAGKREQLTEDYVNRHAPSE